MRIRFFSWLSLGAAATFLVVASTAFASDTVTALSFGVSIGMLVVSVFIAYRYRQSIASLGIGIAASVVSAWSIVASQVFTSATVQTLTLAEGLALSGLVIAGLTSHELSTERVVHSLEVDAAERQPQPRAVAA